MQQSLTYKSLLLKLSGNAYTIDQHQPFWKQFPMDQITLQHLSQRNVKTYDWIQSISIWLNAGTLLAARFTNRTVSIIMLIFVLTVVGISVAAFVDIPWLGIVIMIVGCVALVIYTTYAIIQLKKKVYQIRQSLTQRINTAENGHNVKVEEIYATGCPCCPPVLPLLINIYTNPQ